MKDESLYGTRDPRGHWRPSKLITYPPVFEWPFRPIPFTKWLMRGGNWLPFNIFYGVMGIVIWLYFTPSMSEMKTIAPGWIAYLLLRNAVLVGVIYGVLHLRLYVQKRQDTAFKYNAKWPSSKNSAFLFGRQHIDNLIWTFGSAVPIWTAFEALTLWAFANGVIPYVSFADNPVYCIVLYLLLPLIHEFHFYVVHRIIHIPFLYRTVHRIHHNNVNPGPWSGLAMHPVEHLLYFSGIFIHWVLPSNPVHAIFHIVYVGVTPTRSHSGFDKVIVGEKHAIEMDSYDHYLHHKYFEVNYAGGVIPLDRWFGTFHDGSAEAEAKMNRRLMERAQREAARKEKNNAK